MKIVNNKLYYCSDHELVALKESLELLLPQFKGNVAYWESLQFLCEYLKRTKIPLSSIVECITVEGSRVAEYIWCKENVFHAMPYYKHTENFCTHPTISSWFLDQLRIVRSKIYRIKGKDRPKEVPLCSIESLRKDICIAFSLQESELSPEKIAILYRYVKCGKLTIDHIRNFVYNDLYWSDIRMHRIIFSNDYSKERIIFWIKKIRKREVYSLWKHDEGLALALKEIHESYGNYRNNHSSQQV